MTSPEQEPRTHSEYVSLLESQDVPSRRGSVADVSGPAPSSPAPSSPAPSSAVIDYAGLLGSDGVPKPMSRGEELPEDAVVEDFDVNYDLNGAVQEVSKITGFGTTAHNRTKIARKLSAEALAVRAKHFIGRGKWPIEIKLGPSRVYSMRNLSFAYLYVYGELLKKRSVGDDVSLKLVNTSKTGYVGSSETGFGVSSTAPKFPEFVGSTAADYLPTVSGGVKNKKQSGIEGSAEIEHGVKGRGYAADVRLHGVLAYRRETTDPLTLQPVAMGEGFLRYSTEEGVRKFHRPRYPKMEEPDIAASRIEKLIDTRSGVAKRTPLGFPLPRDVDVRRFDVPPDMHESVARDVHALRRYFDRGSLLGRAAVGKQQMPLLTPAGLKGQVRWSFGKNKKPIEINLPTSRTGGLTFCKLYVYGELFGKKLKERNVSEKTSRSLKEVVAQTNTKSIGVTGKSPITASDESQHQVTGEYSTKVEGSNPKDLYDAYVRLSGVVVFRRRGRDVMETKVVRLADEPIYIEYLSNWEKETRKLAKQERKAKREEEKAKEEEYASEWESRAKGFGELPNFK